MAVVADTSVVIDFLRNRRPGADAVERLLRDRTGYLTAINVFELMIGVARDSRRETSLLQLIRRFRVLPVSVAAALTAARIERQMMRKRGSPIGYADTLIAGCCMMAGIPLLTGNRKHFDRVEGLIVLDPSDPSF